jgi:long-subunit fatty acid transport protein
MIRTMSAAVVAAMLLGGDAVFAQSNAEVNAGVQFDFSLPGARSLGLGGAFVGLADDATSAWANPAGLTILNKQEVSFEARGWNFSNFITARGHEFGAPSGIGVDTIAGLQNAELTDTTGSLAFLSFVYPREKWALALYRHQLSNFKARLQSSGPFLTTRDVRFDPLGEIDRVDPFIGDMSMQIVDYGGSFAYRFGESLSLGASVGLHGFDMESRTKRYSYVPPLPPPVAQRSTYTGVGQRFGPADFDDDNLNIDIVDAGEDTAVAFTIGALWRDPMQRWSAGAAFRQGADFTYQSEARAGRGAVVNGVYSPGQLVDQEEVGFVVPDVYAVGVSGRPTDNLLVTVEYDRVLYAQLSQATAEVFGIEEAPFELNRQIGRLIRENLRFPNANQIRAGAEYAWVRRNSTVLLRLGGWYDPDHRLRFDEENLSEPEKDLVKRLPVLFRPGSNEGHIAPGIGLALRNFQVDVAADFSDRLNTFSLSSVFRF